MPHIIRNTGASRETGAAPAAEPVTMQEHLTASRTVALSAFWNMLGRAGPLVIAVLATPFLVAALGPTRWGLFSLALTLIGLFGIFDFGIGRALTKLLAEKVVIGELEEAARLTRAGIAALTILGIAGGLVLAGLAPIWVDRALVIPAAERPEIVHAVYVLCLAVPFVILNAALWGVISAFQQFRAANLVNMPILAFYYLGPLVVLRFADSLTLVMLVLVGCRLVMTWAYWRICVTEMPLLSSARCEWRHFGALARLGGWMTVSNFVWPILTYIDRFLVAALVSAAAAGYYTTPSDLLNRASLVTFAVMGSAFPALVAALTTDPAKAANLLRRSLLAINGLLFVPILIVAAFSHEILSLWVGASFAASAGIVLQWLALAVPLSAADAVVGGFIDSAGRPDINAKFSLVELCIYLPALAVLLHAFGIRGAAIAWTVRVAFDFGIRTLIAGHLAPALRPVLTQMMWIVAGTTMLLVPSQLMPSAAARCAIMILALVIFAGLVWFGGLTEAERLMARRHVKQADRRVNTLFTLFSMR